VSDGEQAEEPCDEDMQNSQDDARLDALPQPRDDISTATERTANGGDFRLQLPPTHPLAAVQFASEGLQQANPGAQPMSRQCQFGISLTLESNSTFHSPHDSGAALAEATVCDPNMLVANSKNDPASLISAHVLKTFTNLQLKTFFDEQRIPWGRPQDRVQKQLSCFNVYSNVFRNTTYFKNAQGVTIWSGTTGIKVFQHSLRQSVSKMVALLMGIDPVQTCTHKMRERIESILNAQSQTKHIIVLHPVNIKVGKKTHTLWGISTGLHDAPQVTSLLKSAKMPILSFLFFDHGSRRDMPKRMADHQKILSMTRTMTIDNLPADRVNALRWIFHAGTQLPGQIGKDVIDITDSVEQGVYVVKYVHCSDKQTQILKDVLTTELNICAQAMSQCMPVGHSWLPPALRSAWPAHAGDSDGEDSGRFSMISKSVRNYADAVAKAAAANPAPAIPAQVAVAASPTQHGGGWTQQKRKCCNGPTPKFLSQGLYTQFQSTGTPMDHYPVGVFGHPEPKPLSSPMMPKGASIASPTWSPSLPCAASVSPAQLSCL